MHTLCSCFEQLPAGAGAAAADAADAAVWFDVSALPSFVMRRLYNTPIRKGSRCEVYLPKNALSTTSSILRDRFSLLAHLVPQFGACFIFLHPAASALFSRSTLASIASTDPDDVEYSLSPCPVELSAATSISNLFNTCA